MSSAIRGPRPAYLAPFGFQQDEGAERFPVPAEASCVCGKALARGGKVITFAPLTPTREPYCAACYVLHHGEEDAERAHAVVEAYRSFIRALWRWNVVLPRKYWHVVTIPPLPPLPPRPSFRAAPKTPERGEHVQPMPGSPRRYQGRRLTCSICARPFVGYGNRAIYCGPACRQRQFRRRQGFYVRHVPPPLR